MILESLVLKALYETDKRKLAKLKPGATLWHERVIKRRQLIKKSGMMGTPFFKI